MDLTISQRTSWNEAALSPAARCDICIQIEWAAETVTNQQQGDTITVPYLHNNIIIWCLTFKRRVHPLCNGSTLLRDEHDGLPMPFVTHLARGRGRLENIMRKKAGPNHPFKKRTRIKATLVFTETANNHETSWCLAAGQKVFTKGAHPNKISSYFAIGYWCGGRLSH